MFVELAARTHFSFLRGGSSARSLIERAVRLGYDAIGVADCDGLYGMVRALEAAEELGVRLVVGCELAIDDDAIASLWVHVQDHEGYRNLCRLLTDQPRAAPQGQGPGRRRGRGAQPVRGAAARRGVRARGGPLVPGPGVLEEQRAAPAAGLR